MSCRVRQNNASHLFTVHRKDRESLKDYIKHFNQVILEVENPSDKVAVMAMMEGLRPGPLFGSFSKNGPKTLSILQSKANKYIGAEELAKAKCISRGKDDHKRKKLDSRQAEYRDEVKSKRSDRDAKRRTNDRRPRTLPCQPDLMMPPFNALVAQVFMEIKNKEFVKWPGKIKTNPLRGNKNKYCKFHKDHEHNTDDCL
ncbi:hypothetical protein Acr_00g0032400 [Actinidia rufa]|uniref:Retrotransposon gag domain-containing protein n=1 Tax=Actinidia rufa TaxID=165716 RepID=A0A7J0DFK7_9ERIC|nr:hypothetical protein Acr_00g0032400 [Actinidia rufa]